MTSLDDHVRRLVREEIARVLGTTAPTYSTEAGAWPPGCTSRRQARERIRAVAGSERVGRGRATIWRVARDAYDAHHATKRPALRMVTAPTSVDDDELAARVLASADLRATRKAG